MNFHVFVFPQTGDRQRGRRWNEVQTNTALFLTSGDVGINVGMTWKASKHLSALWYSADALHRSLHPPPTSPAPHLFAASLGQWSAWYSRDCLLSFPLQSTLLLLSSHSAHLSSSFALWWILFLFRFFPQLSFALSFPSSCLLLRCFFYFFPIFNIPVVVRNSKKYSLAAFLNVKLHARTIFLPLRSHTSKHMQRQSLALGFKRHNFH